MDAGHVRNRLDSACQLPGGCDHLEMCPLLDVTSRKSSRNCRTVLVRFRQSERCGLGMAWDQTIGVMRGMASLAAEETNALLIRAGERVRLEGDACPSEFRNLVSYSD